MMIVIRAGNRGEARAEAKRRGIRVGDWCYASGPEAIAGIVPHEVVCVGGWKDHPHRRALDALLLSSSYVRSTNPYRSTSRQVSRPIPERKDGLPDYGLLVCTVHEVVGPGLREGYRPLIMQGLNDHTAYELAELLNIAYEQGKKGG